MEIQIYENSIFCVFVVNARELYVEPFCRVGGRSGFKLSGKTSCVTFTEQENKHDQVYVHTNLK